MNIQSMLCSIDATIKEVLTCIDENAKGTAFLTDNENVLCGVVTDGDIRRLLIKGFGLNTRIRNYVNTNFIYAYNTDSSEKIANKFNDAIRILPIVNSIMEVVDFAEFTDNLHVFLAQPQLSGNEYKYLMDAFLSTWISSTGEYITRFEEGFSTYCGVKYGVATSNGTTALHLALLALGIGAGDEVIVPDITFAATINAVLYTGATPVIVDIEEDSWCIDPQAIKSAITEKTKVIIPVHIYGQPCDMDMICDIAKENNLFVVEDCAEAHGAEWKGKKVGAFGIISCFSFFGNKVITTGEGGMCLTNSKELNDKMRVYRDHGMSKNHRYYHEVIGYNYRMTNLQAAIGTAQVENIDKILQWRNQLELKYREKFCNIKEVTLQRNNLSGRNKIAWLISILVVEEKRNIIVEKLKENNIDVRTFFIPLSEMPLYKDYAHDCCISKYISHRGINLPTTTAVNDEVIDKIAAIIEEC